MKMSKAVLIGGAALVAYYLLSQKKAAPSLADSVSQGVATPGGLLGQGSLTDLGYQAKQVVDKIASLPQQVLTSTPAVQTGGAIAGLLGSSTLGIGADSVAANVDYINAVMGSNTIAASILPTTSGSGVLQLTGAPGVPTAQAQSLIDTAIRASSSQYGVSLASGGANVFNITSAGKAATTSNLPTASNPAPSNFGSLSTALTSSSKTSSTPTAQLASLMARGL